MNALRVPSEQDMSGYSAPIAVTSATSEVSEVLERAQETALNESRFDMPTRRLYGGFFSAVGLCAQVQAEEWQASNSALAWRGLWIVVRTRARGLWVGRA